MITLEPYRKETEKQYRALYLSAFPKEERAPWWLLKRRAKQGRAEALAAMDDGRFAGMAYVVTLGDRHTCSTSRWRRGSAAAAPAER